MGPVRSRPRRPAKSGLDPKRKVARRRRRSRGLDMPGGSIDLPLSRGVFLRYSLKAFALTSLTLANVECSVGGVVPQLKGLSKTEYRNANFLSQYFLKGTAFNGFDAGLALDDYLFGRKDSLSIIGLIQDVLGAPSSILASLVMDFSTRTMVQLEGAELEARMESWRNSTNELQSGAYKSFKSLVFVAVSSSQQYQDLAGYPKSAHLVPYARTSALFR